jgi:hypothetical protein
MMGINGPGRKLSEGEIQHLWSNVGTGADLMRVGIEAPEQMAALFLMDGEEIDRITRETKPLTDFYPKRLTDTPPDFDDVYRFAYAYMDGSLATRRFFSSSMIGRTWPDTLKSSVELFFMVRDTRFRAELVGSNRLAELDLYLRHSLLRTPILAVRDSDAFRVSIARRRARGAPSLPAEAEEDLVARALADRDIKGAILLLEQERSRGFRDVKNLLLLVYLYGLDGRTDDAEALANTQIGLIKNDSFVDWLWKELQAQFGFRPPDSKH